MRSLLVLVTAYCLFSPFVEAAPRRRALLIGIDDYSASTLPRRANSNDRGWPDLKGAANDARILAEMLIHAYGFDRRDVLTLTNQQATRAAILQSIDRHLVQSSRPGDVVFYYFAGHGSQVPNHHSDEPDGLDESIVPADSRWGAEDIRDKELRPFFNRILDRRAQLTLVLDHCHSGSAFRGAPYSRQPRGIRRAPAIADPRTYGPRPEERGALVLASTQDLDAAWETRGHDGLMHGAFTWAWIRAMRDATAGEAAEETFLRAHARLRAEAPYQAPVMLGNAAARTRPFLGARKDRKGGRLVVAVESVEPDGTVVVQGGWANGLAVDAELRAPRERHTLRITKILGLGRSIARMKDGRPVPSSIRAGALLEMSRWAAPEGRPLRIWLPDVQTLREELGDVDGTIVVRDQRNADYVLRAREHQYAWLSAWTSDVTRLRLQLIDLRRIHAWQTLESPSSAPYRLALASEKSQDVIREGTLTGGDIYSIVLHKSQPAHDEATPRYYYVFVIDSHGKSYLAFPRTGSVENRLPIRNPAPDEIRIGAPSAFRILPPYGTDTYVLLSTDEPLPNPSILEWDDIRSVTRTLAATGWSIERVTFESVAPHRRRAAAVRRVPMRR